MITGQVAKPVASPHRWAFKLRLKKATETNFNIKKEDLGVHWVCMSESQDCDEPIDLLKNQVWSEHCCFSSAVSGQELKISLESPGHSSIRYSEALCKFSLLPGDHETSAG